MIWQDDVMHLGYSFLYAHLLCTSVSRRLLKEDTGGFLRGAEGEGTETGQANGGRHRCSQDLPKSRGIRKLLRTSMSYGQS